MAQKIIIEALQVETIIGTLPWEQHLPQLLLVDLEVTLPEVVQTDNLEKTVDYTALSEQLIAFMTKQKVQLLETLATRVADWLEQEFLIKKLCVVIRKPGAIKHAKSVGVQEIRG